MKLSTRRSVLRALTASVTLAASAILSAASPAAAASGHEDSSIPLRAATYNIHAGAGEDNVFDLTRTAQALRSLHADVIGLQEVDVHWGARSNFVDEAHELAQQLDMQVFFAPIYDFDPATAGAARRQYGVAVLSRYPIIHAENRKITRLSTQTANPVPAPAPGFADVTVNVRGAHVHVYSTHLDYRSDPSVRRAQITDTINILAADSGPKVLVGDFNAEPQAAELSALWQHGIRDAAPNGGKTYPALNPVKRIDLVTVSPDVRVRRTYEVAATASDHRPVVADLLLQRHED